MHNGVVIERPAVTAPFVTPLPVLRAAFQAGLPYRHLIMDGFLDEELARNLAADFPPPSAPQWKRRRHLHSHKLTLEVLPPTGRVVVEALHSQPVLDWLVALSGVRDLSGDDALFGG